MIFVYILHDKMSKTEKTESATKVTKIPKTKRRKYGMNKTSILIFKAYSLKAYFSNEKYLECKLI